MISVPFVPISEKKVLIEIPDSDDEMQEVKAERQENQAQNENDASNVVTSATNANIGIASNGGPNVMVRIPAMNAAAHLAANRRGSKINAEIASSSSMKAEESETRPKRTKSGQFKCKYCKYGSNLRANVFKHEKMHVREDSMGFARDPKDGLLHCSHCPEQFKQLRGILSHMQKYHSKKI